MTAAIKITADGTVTQVDLGVDVLAGMYREIGCQLVERVGVTADLDLWVDEEGLLVADPEPNVAVTAFVTSLLAEGQRLRQYFYGTALLVAHTDSGDPTALLEGYLPRARAAGAVFGAAC